MCKRGNGIIDGKKAFLAKCSNTEESLPIEYIMTGFDDLEYESLMIEIASDSKFCKSFFEKLTFKILLS